LLLGFGSQNAPGRFPTCIEEVPNFDCGSDGQEPANGALDFLGFADLFVSARVAFSTVDHGSA
jgi:hypothetical protein